MELDSDQHHLSMVYLDLSTSTWHYWWTTSELCMSSAFQPLPWSLTSNSPDIYSGFSCMQSTLHWPTSQALQLCWGLNTNDIWNEIHPITLFFFPSLWMLFGVTACSLCSSKIYRIKELICTEINMSKEWNFPFNDSRFEPTGVAFFHIFHSVMFLCCS